MSSFDKTEQARRILLTVTNVLFIAYYFLLAIFNRLSADDYGFMSWANGNGLFDAVYAMWSTHQGRFMGFVSHWFKFRLMSKVGFFWFDQVYVYIINFISLYLISTKLIKKSAVNFSLLVLNILLITNQEFSAFYWICACHQCLYAHFLLLLYFIFLCDNKLVSIPGTIIVSIFIGGGSEAFSPIVLFIMLAYGVFVLNDNRYNLTITFSNVIVKRLVLSAVIIVVCAAIVFLAPGNANRLAEYEQPDLISFIIQTFKSTALIFYFLLFKLHYILLTALASYVIGKNYGIDLNIKRTKTIFIYSSIVLLAVIWISTIPAAYAMGSFGFQRIYTPIFAITILFVCFWFLYLGASSQDHALFKHSELALNSALLLCIIVQIFNISIDIPTAKAYSDSDKARIELLLNEKAKGRTEPLYLEPLVKPTTFNVKSFVTNKIFNKNNVPVLYYSNEIETNFDPDDINSGFTNKCIKNYYELPFDIYRK